MLQEFNGRENMNKMRRKWKIEKDPNMSSREEHAPEWDLRLRHCRDKTSFLKDIARDTF